MAVCAVAVASVFTIGSAVFYSNKQVEAIKDQAERQRRRDRRKNRERLSKTAEY